MGLREAQLCSFVYEGTVTEMESHEPTLASVSIPFHLILKEKVSVLKDADAPGK